MQYDTGYDSNNKLTRAVHLGNITQSVDVYSIDSVCNKQEINDKSCYKKT